jgi:signal transduction histidine kinase
MKFKVRLLLVGFLVSFLLVAALSAISFIRTGRLGARVALVEHSYTVTNTINSLKEDLVAMDRTMFRYMVTNDSTYLPSFGTYAGSLQKSTDRLREITNADEKQQEHVITLQADEALYISDCREFLKLQFSDVQSLLASKAFLENKSKLQTLWNTLNDMADRENRLLAERTHDRRIYMQLTTSLIRVLSVVFSLITTLLFFLLLREFVKRQQYQAELQQRLAEIAQSKRELEHIAYATSHDLQEPLRKIRILTDKWYSQNKETLSEENVSILKRVSGSATRMHELVSELMVLASLNEDSKKVPCPLEQYVNAACNQLTAIIAEKNARIDIEPLHTIPAFPEQLSLLFRHLIDNSLKFARPDTPLIITISGRRAGSTELFESNTDSIKYYCVSIADNGLGFDNRQVDKMFGIFRQLHTAQEGSSGKGMGLAICQRIMNNHRGHILAHGFPNEGATFKLYFPIKD